MTVLDTRMTSSLQFKDLFIQTKIHLLKGYNKNILNSINRKISNFQVAVKQLEEIYKNIKINTTWFAKGKAKKHIKWNIPQPKQHSM